MNFFSNICDLDNIEKAALDALCGGNLGELFLEYQEDEVIRIEDGVVQTPSFSSRRGFGLRSFFDDSSRYSYSSSLDIASIKKAVAVVNAGFSEDCSGVCVKSSESSRKTLYERPLHNELFFARARKDAAQDRSVLDVHEDPSSGSDEANCEKEPLCKGLYEPHRFVDSITLEDKINFLKSMDGYARSKSTDIRQVVAVLASSWQVVNIVTDSGEKSVDFRPLVRLTVSIVVERNGLMESGTYSGGGRHDYQSLVSESVMKSYVDEALRQANVKLEAIKAPVGEMPVVLGNGWTGILLHEAIGHGLEGDAIRKKTSSFHNLLGECVASPGVTVVDDGTIENRRGSINVDDEGTPSARNVLIENGKLVGFMQDRMNAKLMGLPVTGNGRRENYENLPIPRMTNTFMLSGDHSFDEMVSCVKNGVFAKSFSDGQVDVASGKFVFSASEAYLIENGRVTTPVKGAMLIGDGPSILRKISMVGNDFALDPGIGTCGKRGQWVPVGVGEPSVLIDSITVGGANLG